MVPLIEVTDSPTESDKSALLDGLRAYNFQASGMTVSPIAVWMRGETGEVIGGLAGRTGGGWLFIEFFWLAERWRGRGFGSELIRRAEEEAIARGCIGAWLDTFSFQAPDFYQRHGYETFGSIDDYPSGHCRHFMCKRFAKTRQAKARRNSPRHP